MYRATLLLGLLLVLWVSKVLENPHHSLHRWLQDAGKKAAEHGVKSVDVEVRGLDLGKNLHLEHYRLLDLPLIRLEMLHQSHITVVDQENVVAYNAIYFNFLNDGAIFI